MEAFFFGNDQERLYGVYHPPQSSEVRNTGIVICNPLGDEYVSSHRSLRILANKLSEEGFHVLRFDYYGCGDSSGNLDDIKDMNPWVNNIHIAVNEIKEGTDVRSVVLIGLRLGANLCLRYISKYPGIERIILWDPLDDGKKYLLNSIKSYRKWVKGTFISEKYIKKDEFFGCSVTKELMSVIKEICVNDYACLSDFEAIIIKSKDNGLSDKIVSNLNTKFSKLKIKEIEDHCFWVKNSDDVNKSLVPVNAINTIVKSI